MPGQDSGQQRRGGRDTCWADGGAGQATALFGRIAGMLPRQAVSAPPQTQGMSWRGEGWRSVEPVLRTNADAPSPPAGGHTVPSFKGIALGALSSGADVQDSCGTFPSTFCTGAHWGCTSGVPCPIHTEDVNLGGPLRPGWGQSGPIPHSWVRTVPGILKTAPSEGCETSPGQVSPPSTFPPGITQAPSPLGWASSHCWKPRAVSGCAGQPLSATGSDLRPLKTVPTLASGQPFCSGHPEPLTPCTLSGVCANQCLSPTRYLCIPISHVHLLWVNPGNTY